MSEVGFQVESDDPIVAPAHEPKVPRLITGTVEFTADEIARILTFSPLPDQPEDPTNRFHEDEAAARFGQALFYDKRFSANGEVA